MNLNCTQTGANLSPVGQVPEHFSTESQSFLVVSGWIYGNSKDFFGTVNLLVKCPATRFFSFYAGIFVGS